MTTQTEALKLALEALEPLIVERTCEAMDAGEKAITAIKEALAQPDENKSALSLYESGFIDGREKGLKEAQPEQEPLTENGMYRLGYHNGYGFGEAYGKANAPQRTWVGLTEEEINKVLGGDIHDEPNGLLEFVRAIEAKLKQKNGYAEEKNT